MVRDSKFVISFDAMKIDAIEPLCKIKRSYVFEFWSVKLAVIKVIMQSEDIKYSWSALISKNEWIELNCFWICYTQGRIYDFNFCDLEKGGKPNFRQKSETFLYKNLRKSRRFFHSYQRWQKNSSQIESCKKMCEISFNPNNTAHFNQLMCEWFPSFLLCLSYIVHFYFRNCLVRSTEFHLNVELLRNLLPKL